jgi:hypothetical protein
LQNGNLEQKDEEEERDSIKRVDASVNFLFAASRLVNLKGASLIIVLVGKKNSTY